MCSTRTFQVTCETYKRSVSKGLSLLRQDEDFVDMTLACEGQFLRVHRNLLALASPYIKKLIKSAPCPHPILFLHNIKYKSLTYIISYIYDGEVHVPTDQLESFISAAKDLEIQGIMDIISTLVSTATCIQTTTPWVEEPITTESTITFPLYEEESETTNMHTDLLIFRPRANASEASGNGDIVDTVFVKNMHDHNEYENNKAVPLTKLKEIVDNDMVTVAPTSMDSVMNSYEAMDTTNVTDLSNPEDGNNFEINLTTDSPSTISNPSIKASLNVQSPNITSHGISLELGQANDQPVQSVSAKDYTSLLQYSTSNRGSLLLILNRYVYYHHHQAGCGRRRRWRCSDYRAKRCPAYVDTEDGIVVKRKFDHCHPFHDTIISKKKKKMEFFDSLEKAQSYISKKSCKPLNDVVDIDEALNMIKY